MRDCRFSGGDGPECQSTDHPRNAQETRGTHAGRWFSALILSLALPLALRAGNGAWSSNGPSPQGGPVFSLAISASDPDILYAGTRGAVMGSTDGGATWSSRSSGLPSTLADVYESIVMDPVALGTLYTVTINPSTQTSGVFKSTDGGTTWQTADAGLTGYLFCMGIAPTTPSTLYTAGANGVFKSTDGGLTWTTTMPYYEDAPIYALAIDPGSPSLVYAGSGTATVYESTDAGNTWTTESIPGISGNIVALTLDPTNPSTVYAAVDTGYTAAGSGIYKSTDGGATWSLLDAGLSNTSVEALAIDPASPSTLFTGTASGGVYKTIDAGGNWAPSGLGTGYVTVLALAPGDPSTVFAGTTGGVYVSKDGGTSWNNTGMQGFGNIGISALDVAPGTQALFAGTIGAGVFRSSDGGTSWVPSGAALDAGSIVAFAIAPAPLTTVYAAANAGGAFASADGGATWDAINTGLTSLWISALTVDPGSPNYLYAVTPQGVFKSTDGGQTWNDLNPNAPNQFQAVSIIVDPSNPSTLYLANNDDGTPYDNGVYKSTDGGTTWSAINSGLPALPMVNALALDPLSSSTLYAGTISGLFKSLDGGNTWNSVGSPLNNDAVVALAINPQDSSTLYVSTNGSGVFESSDGGATWSAINVGLPANAIVWQLAIDPQPPFTLYGSTGSGILSFTQTSSTCTLSCTASAPATGQANTPISFQASATPSSSCSSSTPSYSWNFGDGNTSSQQNPSHAYSSAGTYDWSMSTSLPGGFSCVQTGSIAISSSSSSYSIFGTITSAGSGLHGVTVSAGGATASTDSNGDFTLSELADGTYTVTPSLPGYAFSPTSQSVTVNGESVTGINFTAATTATYSLSGTVTLSGAGLAGVTVTAGSASAKSGSTGAYTISGLVNGTYTVTPSLRGYTFSPASTSETVNGGNVMGVSFTASPGCPTIILSETSLPNSAVGAAYSQTLTASGGVAPYGFVLTGGALPAGLALSSGGIIAGTPSAAGDFTFTVTASDRNACKGSAAYNVTIVPPPSVTRIQKMGSPFRCVVKGSNLQEGVRVYLNGTQWTTFTWKSSTKIVVKGGASLKALVPKNTPVTFTFINPDGGTATVSNWSW